MEAVQKENWYFMALLISLAFIKGLSRSYTMVGFVQVPPGTKLCADVSEALQYQGSIVKLQEGMRLDCTCPWSGNLIMVSWTKDALAAPLAIYHPEYGINFSAAYDGRVEFVRASAMDGSIRISNVTEKDEGVYYCSVQTFPHGSWSKDILVQKQADTTPVFYHSPNTRYLTVSESEDVTITCSQNNTRYNVSLEKMEVTDGGSGLVAVCKQGYDGVELNRFLARGVVNCSDAMEMELRLTNVDQRDGGNYRCNFSTDEEVSSHIIQLMVVFNPKGHGWYIYTAAGVAGALVLMSVALLFSWRSRRKVRRLEYRPQLHTTKREHSNVNVQGGVYDKMNKTTRKQRKNNPIYVNFQNTRVQKKGKR